MAIDPNWSCVKLYSFKFKLRESCVKLKYQKGYKAWMCGFEWKLNFCEKQKISFQTKVEDKWIFIDIAMVVGHD